MLINLSIWFVHFQIPVAVEREQHLSSTSSSPDSGNRDRLSSSSNEGNESASHASDSDRGLDYVSQEHLHVKV